jgi:hypothetical protein
MARDAGWRAGVATLDPDGSGTEPLAVYLILTIVRGIEAPAAARSIALRLEHDFRLIYDRSLPPAHRQVLHWAGPGEGTASSAL